jgi:Flp pilus assembly protein CpaB
MAVTFSASGTASAGGVQQSYALEHTALLEGQLSDIRDNTIGTYINETGAVLPFGNVVVYNTAGTAANSAATISGASDTVQGINVLTYVDETALDSNSRPGVKNQQVLNVANEGAVAVYVTGAVSPTSPVRVLYSASGTGKAGQFSHAFASGKTVRLANARFLSTTTSSGIAILELNGPSFTLSADS